LIAYFVIKILLKKNTTRVTPRIGYKDFPLDSKFKFNQVDSHWTFGIGIQTRVSRLLFGVDFAYVPFDKLGDTSMIDLRLYF
jgi:hypothetical protein